MVIVASIYSRFYNKVRVGTFLRTPAPPKIPSESTALDGTHICELKETISTTFFKHGEQKPSISSNTMNQHKQTSTHDNRSTGKYCATCHHAEQSECKLMQVVR
jgi:hypothetical protein